MKTCTFTFILACLFCFAGYAQHPVFTGNAPADFLNATEYQFFIDFANDVGLPAAAPDGTDSGWDINTAFFCYDETTDDLYVGVDFDGIFGDADGDGDPSTSASWLTALDGTDHANLGNTEGFVLAFDNGSDGNYDVYVGVSRMDDISKFGLYEFTSSLDVAPDQFPVAARGTVDLHSDVFNADNPDLEFTIRDISDYIDNLCKVDFAIFAGSYEDGPIGEDQLNASMNLCASLPVNFTSFVSAAKGRRVQLDWSLATETDNDYFEIQHAGDAGGTFTTIGKVAGRGTTLTPTAYTFYHDSPSKGNNYYRIKQVDYAGTASYSWVITARYKDVEGSTIEVYPNPNTGEFMLGLPNIVADTKAQIRIIDTNGRVVAEQNASLQAGLTAHPIYIEGLAKGYYYALLWLDITQNTYHKGFVVR